MTVFRENVNRFSFVCEATGYKYLTKQKTIIIFSRHVFTLFWGQILATLTKTSIYSKKVSFNMVRNIDDFEFELFCYFLHGLWSNNDPIHGTLSATLAKKHFTNKLGEKNRKNTLKNHIVLNSNFKFHLRSSTFFYISFSWY